MQKNAPPELDQIWGKSRLPCQSPLIPAVGSKRPHPVAGRMAIFDPFLHQTLAQEQKAALPVAQQLFNVGVAPTPAERGGYVGLRVRHARGGRPAGDPRFHGDVGAQAAQGARAGRAPSVSGRADHDGGRRARSPLGRRPRRLPLSPLRGRRPWPGRYCRSRSAATGARASAPPARPPARR